MLQYQILGPRSLCIKQSVFQNLQHERSRFTEVYRATFWNTTNIKCKAMGYTARWWWNLMRQLDAYHPSRCKIPSAPILTIPDGLYSSLDVCRVQSQRWERSWQSDRMWYYPGRADVFTIHSPDALNHARWFYDGPAFVRSWKMSFDHAITYQEMFCLAWFTEAVEQTSLEPISHPEEPILADDDNIPAKRPEGKDDVIGPFLSGDWFTRNGLPMFAWAYSTSVLGIFAKTIQDFYRSEEYVRTIRDYLRIMAKLDKKNGKTKR